MFGRGFMDWFYLAEDTEECLDLVNKTGSVKCREFFEGVRNYQLLKKDSFPWNYLACEEHTASICRAECANWPKLAEVFGRIVKILGFLSQTDVPGIDEASGPVMVQSLLICRRLIIYAHCKTRLPFEFRSALLYGVCSGVLGSHVFGTWIIVPALVFLKRKLARMWLSAALCPSVR
jgi:hypothetical protein